MLSVAAVALYACSEQAATTRVATKLDITPVSAHLHPGETAQFSVEGANGAVYWSTADPTVATVDFGRVTAVGSGTTTLRAVSGTARASAPITVTRSATIVLATSSATFNAVSSAALPPLQTIAITNGGDDALTGLAAGPVTYGPGATGWLSASVDATTAPASLVLRPTTTSLPRGSYTATVPVSASSATNGPLTVTVTYDVISQAVIQLGSTTASFSAQQNASAPAAQQIAITNGGDAPLTGLGVGTITYSGNASGWLTAGVSPAAAPATLTLQPNTTALAPNVDYTATVPVTSTTSGVASASITVTYRLSQALTPASIVLSTNSLAFAATRGAALPTPQAVSVSDGGQVALTGLSVTVTSYGAGASGWLAASINSTTAPATITVQPNTTALTGSSTPYTATIRVSSSVSGVSAQDIQVSYVVSEPPAIGLTATTATFLSTQANVNPASQTIGVSNAGGGTLSGLAATVAFGAGEPSGWLSASVASTVPLAPNTTPLTLDVTTGSIFPGTYHATVTLSAPGVTSRVVTVTFTRQATLASDVQPIFVSNHCTGCHTTANMPSYDNIDLSSTAAAASSLIGKPSPSFPTTDTLVIVGDSARSYLLRILKAQGKKTADNMPPTCATAGASPCLDLTTVHLIGVWIQQGARVNP